MSRYWKYSDNREIAWETRGDAVWNLVIGEESYLTIDDLSRATGVIECDEFGQPIEKP